MSGPDDLITVFKQEPLDQVTPPQRPPPRHPAPRRSARLAPDYVPYVCRTGNVLLKAQVYGSTITFTNRTPSRHPELPYLTLFQRTREGKSRIIAFSSLSDRSKSHVLSWLHSIQDNPADAQGRRRVPSDAADLFGRLGFNRADIERLATNTRLYARDYVRT